MSKYKINDNDNDNEKVFIAKLDIRIQYIIKYTQNGSQLSITYSSQWLGKGGWKP